MKNQRRIKLNPAMSDLNSVFYLTEAKLQVNREGRVHPSQVSNVRHWRQSPPNLLSGPFVFLMLAWFCVIGAGLLVFTGNGEMSIFALIGAGVLVAFGGITALIAQGRPGIDHANERVLSVTGHVTLTVEANRKSMFDPGVSNWYYLKVRDKTWYVNNRVARAFRKRGHYTLYYTEQSNVLIAAEVHVPKQAKASQHKQHE